MSHVSRVTTELPAGVLVHSDSQDIGRSRVVRKKYERIYFFPTHRIFYRTAVHFCRKDLLPPSKMKKTHFGPFSQYHSQPNKKVVATSFETNHPYRSL